MKPAVIQPKFGDTFEVDPKGGTNLHLWIFVSLYQMELDDVEYAWIVNLSTDAKADTTCKLSKVDHPEWIRQDCHVWYTRAMWVELSRLTTWVEEGKDRAPLREDVLRKVWVGAKNCQQANKDLKASITIPPAVTKPRP